MHLNFQALRLCASFFTKLPRLGGSKGIFRFSSQAATSVYFSTTHGTGQYCGSGTNHCISLLSLGTTSNTGPVTRFTICCNSTIACSVALRRSNCFLGFQMLHNSNKKISSRDENDNWFCLMGTDDYEAGRFGYVPL